MRQVLPPPYPATPSANQLDGADPTLPCTGSSFRGYYPQLPQNRSLATFALCHRSHPPVSHGFTLLRWLRTRFDFAHDMAEPAEIVADMEAGIAFKGTNLCVLFFAILVASVG